MQLILQNYKKREFSPHFQQKNSRKKHPAAFEHMKLLMQK
jgi:ribosomal protein S21